MKDLTNSQTPNHNQYSSGVIRLTHAALMTKNLELAVQFYVEVLGLQLRIEEDDPIRAGHHRAMLTDGTGSDVIELIEYADMQHASVPGHGAVNHIGFGLPERNWLSLRSRLDTMGYPYQELESRLFLRDADEVVLEIIAE